MRCSLFLSLLAGIVFAQAGQEDIDNSLERQRKQTCLQQCDEQDVDCKAICDKAPHPKPIHMNLMTECVQHCDVLKGDGSAANIKQYGACYESCITGYMNLGNSQAAPTTKTWVDLVTPTTHMEKAASATASDVEATGSAAGNDSAIATRPLTTVSGLVSTMTSAINDAKSLATASPSASGQSKTLPAKSEVSEAGTSLQLAAGGTLIAAFVVGMLLM